MHIFLPIHAQSVQFFKMLHSFAEESLRGAAIKVSSVSQVIDILSSPALV